VGKSPPILDNLISPLEWVLDETFCFMPPVFVNSYRVDFWLRFRAEISSGFRHCFDYRAASAKINPDGTFTLTTNEPNDGCVKGTHPVAIIALEPLGPSAQKWHAPKKYNSTETSGLTITVDKPTQDLKIEITWSGGKPFLDKFEKE
jgi:hypothetical protein